MTTTIEDIENYIAKAEGYIANAKRDLAELKKQSEPCPLEEGKQADMDQEKNLVWIKDHIYSGSVAVERNPEDSDVDNWCVVLRYPFGEKESCLEEARKMIGGKTD